MVLFAPVSASRLCLTSHILQLSFWSSETTERNLLYRESPDSTNLGAKGNHTIEKIALIALHFNPKLQPRTTQPQSQKELFNLRRFNHEFFNPRHFNHELFNHELFNSKAKRNFSTPGFSTMNFSTPDFQS